MINEKPSLHQNEPERKTGPAPIFSQSAIPPTIGYEYDGGYRLATDSVYIYSYDANGNQTQKVRREDGAAWSYGYDAEDRLTNAVLADASGTVFVAATYTYDLAGRRTSKEVNGAVTRYEYDGLALVAEYDGHGNRTARWFYPPGAIDSPTAMERGGRLFLYVYDERGSVVSITDEQGNELQRYAYDAFGRVALSQGQVANPFLFTGREYDPETGLYFYRARVYDPDTGRFLQQDPVFSLNLYPYAGNDPVNNSDPLGLEVEVLGPYSYVSSSVVVMGVSVPTRITMAWFIRGTEGKDGYAVAEWLTSFCSDKGLTAEECHCGFSWPWTVAPGRTGETWAGLYKGSCSIDINLPGDCGDGNSDGNGGNPPGEKGNGKPPTNPPGGKGKNPPGGRPPFGGDDGKPPLKGKGRRGIGPNDGKEHSMWGGVKKWLRDNKIAGGLEFQGGFSLPFIGGYNYGYTLMWFEDEGWIPKAYTIIEPTEGLNFSASLLPTVAYNKYGNSNNYEGDFATINAGVPAASGGYFEGGGWHGIQASGGPLSHGIPSFYSGLAHYTRKDWP